jgi:enamine deaminase RidA (YjgF/YER057c/UK114 family)
VTQWTTRLAELGIVLPQVAAPVGAYTAAVRSGAYVYTSGQLPLVDGVLPMTGKVGADLDAGRAAELARISTLNALAAVDALVGIDAVTRVLKVVGFVASAPSFTGQAKVVDGASTLLHQVFGESGVHARSALGMAVLPLDSPVEIELHLEIAPSKTSA